MIDIAKTFFPDYQKSVNRKITINSYLIFLVLPNNPEEMCFNVNPQAGESGFSQWVSAMKMVAQLPGGIPPEFRKRLWLTMAEKHLASKGVRRTNFMYLFLFYQSKKDNLPKTLRIVLSFNHTHTE